MSTWRRRAVTIPATFAVAVVSVASAPLWIPVTAVVDLARGRRRLPLTRLALFGVRWAWLETAGVSAAAWLWIRGRARDRSAHVRLQRWWVDRVVRAVQGSTGLRIEVPDVSPLGGDRPIVVLSRHASLADSVVSAWVLAVRAGREPRYVLKRELLADPCLDVVGHRLHNHFLDRHAADSGPELAALRALSASMGPNEAAVIFPEGTRASVAKRQRMLAKLRERDPQRADRFAGLRHLLPPRPAGAAALLEGCPEADVVLAWHTGFDGMDTFGGIVRRLSARRPVARFEMRRVPRAEVPSGAEFTGWLDEQWLTLDALVAERLGPARAPAGTAQEVSETKERISS